MFNSKKQCEIKYGRLNGIDSLMRHFEQSSVMHQNVSARGAYLRL